MERNLPYIPIVVRCEESHRLLKDLTPDERAICTKIAKQIGEMRLSPLKAQAVLVEAWKLLQVRGTIFLTDICNMERVPVPTDPTEWFEGLSERFFLMTEPEQDRWIKETEDGQSFASIMNSSWREGWEDGINQEYQRRYGGMIPSEKTEN